jgi:hypothetical protein
MAGDDSKYNEFKLKQKEHARLARKAAYAQQKAKMEERKAAQKADPEYKKAQLIKRDEQRQRYKELKAKLKLPKVEKSETLDQEKIEERLKKDQTVIASLKLAKDLHKIPAETNNSETFSNEHSYSLDDDDTPYVAPKPKLRLVKSGDCS